jgi:hypothetical protein
MSYTYDKNMNWNWNNDIEEVIDNEKLLKYIKSLCDKWELNKLKNPITNLKIKKNKGWNCSPFFLYSLLFLIFFSFYFFIKNDIRI